MNAYFMKLLLMFEIDIDHARVARVQLGGQLLFCRTEYKIALNVSTYSPSTSFGHLPLLMSGQNTSCFLWLMKSRSTCSTESIYSANGILAILVPELSQSVILIRAGLVSCVTHRMYAHISPILVPKYLKITLLKLVAKELQIPPKAGTIVGWNIR